MGHTQYVGESLDVGAHIDSVRKGAPKRDAVVESEGAGKEFSLPLIVLFILPLIVGAFVLSSTASLGVLERVFAQQAENAISSEVMNSMRLQFPQLSAPEQEAIARDKIVKALGIVKEKGLVKKLALENSMTFRDVSGTPYVFEIDGFYFFRYADNIVNNGHRGEILKDGVPFDTLRRKPQGLGAENTLLPYVEAYFFKVWRVFSSSVTLSKSSFFLPVFLGVISIALMFCLTLLLTSERVVAFFTAMLFAVHPYFFRQNMAGFTDTTTLIMPLSLAFFICLIFVAKGKTWQRPAGVLGALFFLCALKFSWGGWYFVLAVAGGFCGLLALFTFVRVKDKRMRLLLGSSSAVLSVAFFMFLWWFGHLHKVLVKFQIGNRVPGIHETVQELMAPTVGVWIHNFGGTFFAAVVLVGIVILLHRLYAGKGGISELFVLAWFAVLFFPTVKSARFMFFLVPSVCVFAGVGLSFLRIWLSKVVGGFDIASFSVASGVLLLLLPVSLCATMVDIGSVPFPRMHGGIVSTGEWFKENTAVDSIINTWWDYGYLWQYSARRGTVLDAGPTDASHWMARAFLSSNESESLDIFRMLDCGGHDILEIYKQRFHTAAGYVLDEVVHSSRGDASRILEKRGAVDLLNLTHCDPPESYLIVNKDMVDAVPSMNVIARWNVTLGYLREVTLDLSANEAIDSVVRSTGLSREDAERVYYDAYAQELPIPEGVISSTMPCKLLNSTVWSCWEFAFDTVSLDSVFRGKHPHSVIFFRDGVRREREFEAGVSKYTLVIFENSDGVFNSFIVSPEYRDSLFLRLYARDTFEHFKFMHEELNPERIIVWKVEWPQVGVASKPNESVSSKK